MKCPYSLRESETLEYAAKCNTFCLNHDKSLKRNHRYYTQVQLQLYVYNVDHGYFIIWTPKWVFYILVSKDIFFISPNAFETERILFTKYCPRATYTRKLEHSVDKAAKPAQVMKEKTLYCYCQTEYNDQETWIGCDSTSCKWAWFHLECVKLKRVPKGNWYCPKCRKAKKKF